MSVTTSKDSFKRIDLEDLTLTASDNSSISWSSSTGTPLKFVAVASFGNSQSSAISTDSVTWQQNTAAFSTIYGEQRSPVISNSDKTLFYTHTNLEQSISTDGLTWTTTTLDPAVQNAYAPTPVYADGKFVMVYENSINPTVRYSTDAITWTYVTVSNFGQHMTYGNGKFVYYASSYGYAINMSTDALTWTQTPFQSEMNFAKTKFINNLFVRAGGFTNYVEYSTDAVTWTTNTIPDGLSYTEIEYGNGFYLLIGSSGQVQKSTDLVTWTEVATVAIQTPTDLSFSAGKFYLSTSDSGVGSDLSVYSSTNGVTWVQSAKPSAFMVMSSFGGDVVESNVNINSNGISTTEDITAANFIGNGSGLTDITGLLPSINSQPTADLSVLLNVPVSVDYDSLNNNTLLTFTPDGTIDNAGITAFNTSIPGGTNFTLSFTNSMNNPPVSYSTTFTKTGAAENVMGTTINVPVQYVSGNEMLSSFGATVTIVYGQSDSGKMLTNDGTTALWGPGIPSLGSTTTANLGTLLNVSVGYNYDQMSSPTQVVLTPYGTIDDAALAEFNIAVPGTTNFTLTFVDIGMGIDYSTTFTKTGAAENVMGMQITIPVQYVSGDILAGATDPTISYGTSSAGKFLTNDGDSTLWADADLKSSASGSLSALGTASWPTWPVNAYPSGNPYGIKTINGQKRIIMPNVANFQNMPIGSTVTFTDMYVNDGMGAAPIEQTFTTTGLYDGNGFNIAGDPFDTETSDPYGNHTFTISWTGTEPEHTITADDLRLLSPDAAGSVHQQLDILDAKKIVLEKFEGSPSDKTATVTTTWTVPAGVYSIDATLIGGGGAGGGVSISVIGATGSGNNSNSYGQAGVNTTITYNGTVYTALGGDKGIEDVATAFAPYWSWFDNGGSTNSSTSSSFPFDKIGSKKPGRGGIPSEGSGEVKNYIDKTVDGVSSFFEVGSSVRARGSWGFDGEERHFTIPVVPGSTLELSVGGNGQDITFMQDPPGTATSNPGAIYLRYIG